MHRLLKEVNYYKKEVEENEAKLALLKEEKRDIYDIKKFEEVLGESYMMVPESEGRLKRSLEDLASFLDSDEFLINQGNSVQNKTAGATETEAGIANTTIIGEWEPTARSLLEENLIKRTPPADTHKTTATAVMETVVSGLKDDEDF